MILSVSDESWITNEIKAIAEHRGILHNISINLEIPTLNRKVLLWKPNEAEQEILEIVREFKKDVSKDILVLDNFSEAKRHIAHYIAEMLGLAHASFDTSSGARRLDIWRPQDGVTVPPMTRTITWDQSCTYPCDLASGLLRASIAKSGASSFDWSMSFLPDLELPCQTASTPAPDSQPPLNEKLVAPDFVRTTSVRVLDSYSVLSRVMADTVRIPSNHKRIMTGTSGAVYEVESASGEKVIFKPAVQPARQNGILTHLKEVAAYQLDHRGFR